MRRILVVLLVLALALLLLAPAVFAGPPGDGICGKDYGQFHAGLAKAGATGQTHKPGVDHHGAAGLCLGKF